MDQMPVTGDDDEEPPFRPLTPEQKAAIERQKERANARRNKGNTLPSGNKLGEVERSGCDRGER